MSENKMEALINKKIKDVVQNMNPSGSVLLAINDALIYEQSFGNADIANKIPMSIDTQMLVGSVTKQFTAVAILKALFDKKMNIQEALNTSVAHYLPESHEIWSGSIPTWANQVTVHQLLCHSSGIPNYTSLQEFEKQNLPKTSDVVAFFKDLELEFTPGSRFSYCNSGYILLGVIVQEISGHDFDAYLEQSFFKPFDMRSSFFPTKGTVNDLIKSDPRFKNLARGYQFEIEKQDACLEEINNYVEMQIPGAGGSLISTAPDLLKWNNALYSMQIIPDFLLELMLQPHIPTENGKDHYGYGIEVMNSDSLGVFYNHRGGIPGFHSTLTYIPKLDLSIVILENIVEDTQNLKSEIESIKAGLPKGLSEDEKIKQVDKVIESRYPHIIENRQRYQLASVHAAVIETVGNLSD